MEKLIEYYSALKMLYVDDIIEKDDCYVISSNIIDDGIWNFILIKSTVNYKKFLETHKDTSHTHRFYLLNPSESTLAEIKNDYNIYCKDSIFCTNIDELTLNYKSKLAISISETPSKNDVISTIMNGFSTHDPNDPYGDLSPTYKQCLEQKFNLPSAKCTVKHFVAYFNNTPIGIATVTYNNSFAFLNNVTTLKEYKNKGVSKEIMSNIISFLKYKKINKIMFLTETNAYTETFYLKLGFKISDYGVCFEPKEMQC